jgi:ATP-dependent exoDNAse (exonuclease V) alpha subunit
MRHDKIVAHALRYGWQSGVSVEGVQGEIVRRVQKEELKEVFHAHRQSAAPRYATEKQRQLEREVIIRALRGRDTLDPIEVRADLTRYNLVNENPRRQEVIRSILATRDQTVILQGGAGTGKTTSLRIIAEIAQEHGYEVVGLAPTGKAADSLRSIGIRAETLQRELMQNQPGLRHKQRFYFVDESSLTSTKQFGKFYGRVSPQDRVLLIGDDSPKRRVGQHHSVEAGRMFYALQQAGVKTAQLNKILRQKEPWLLDIVRHFRNGHTAKAIGELDQRGKILDYFATPAGRYAHIAQEYAKHREGTLVVSPDNKSRSEINTAIRSALRRRDMLGPERPAAVLVARDPGSKANLRVAATYRSLDRVRYMRGSKAIGIRAGEYATVIDVDRPRNQITALANGRQITYDPKQLSSVAIYEEREIGLAVGDRVQFTAPFRQKALRTRETGTVKAFDGKDVTVALDNGKTSRWSLDDFRHIDYGYVSTSHAAQSATVERCIVNVDTGDSRLRSLHGQVFAYVASSRPEYDLVIVTDDKAALIRELGRSTERETALSREEIQQVAGIGG